MTARLVGLLGWAERSAAWFLLAVGLVFLVIVLAGQVETGDSKWVTVLVALDLTVSGLTAVQASRARDT